MSRCRAGARTASARWWPAGRRHGYHGVSCGFILSGLVRAVTGRSFGRFFADEVAAPLDLDLFVGVLDDRLQQVSPMTGPSHRQALLALLNRVWLPYALSMINRRSVGYRATFGGTAVGVDDAAELLRFDVEDASAGAVANGLGLARMFAALIGEVDGLRLISAELMNTARQTQASGRDAVLQMRTDWGLGFVLPGGPMWPHSGVPGLFGHSGGSGFVAFADPEHRVAFGYTPNLWSELARPFRAPASGSKTLTAAVYRSLDVRRWRSRT